MNPQLAPRLLNLCRPLALLLSTLAGAANVSAQQPNPRPTPFKVEAPAETATTTQTSDFTLRWKPTPRVTRYRLQVARDPDFRDIVFDGAVNGLEHKVTGLPPGRYHWRVAPAPKETGRFSAGEVVEATESTAASDPTPLPTRSPATTSTPVTTATPSTAATPATAAVVLRSPANVGWQAAIGKVQRPVPARLRAGQQVDLVAVNSEGTVYALEGANGAALWTARYRPPVRGVARQGDPPKEVFTPLVVGLPERETVNVLVGFDGGVRLIEGETGRELWRAALTGRAAGGSVGELDGKPDTVEIAIATAEPAQLYMLDAATGRTVAQAKLAAEVVGLPIPFQAGDKRGVAVAVEGGQLSVWQADGTLMRGVRLDVPFVTPPLVISSPRGTAVIIGTRSGLLFFDGVDLKPLGRISTENDSPRGRLAAADLDGDGVLEIALLTKNGRIAIVSANGRIVWSAVGGAGAYSASFADLNRDGVLDVLVADDAVFARGFSGRDGTLIWQAEESRGEAAGGEAQTLLRSLSVANIAGADTAFIVGGDTARGTVRAVGMPVVAGRAAAR